MKYRFNARSIVVGAVFIFNLGTPLNAHAGDFTAKNSDSWNALAHIFDSSDNFMSEAPSNVLPNSSARQTTVTCEIKTRRSKSGKSQKYCPKKATCSKKRPYCVSKIVRTRSGKRKASCGCSAKAPETNGKPETPSPTPPPVVNNVCDDDLPLPQLPLVTDPEILYATGRFPVRKVCGTWYFYEISEQSVIIGGYDITFQFFKDGSYRIDYLYQARVGGACFGGAEWKSYELGNFIFFEDGGIAFFPSYWRADASSCGLEFTKEKSPTSADIRGCSAGEVAIGSDRDDAGRTATGGLGLICEVTPWQAPYAKRQADYPESTSVFALQRVK